MRKLEAGIGKDLGMLDDVRQVTGQAAVDLSQRLSSFVKPDLQVPDWEPHPDPDDPKMLIIYDTRYNFPLQNGPVALDGYIDIEVVKTGVRKIERTGASSGDSVRDISFLHEVAVNSTQVKGSDDPALVDHKMAITSVGDTRYNGVTVNTLLKRGELSDDEMLNELNRRAAQGLVGLRFVVDGVTQADPRIQAVPTRNIGRLETRLRKRIDIGATELTPGIPALIPQNSRLRRRKP